MSEIRVTYSGLISFILSLIGIIPATIFMLIATRSLTPYEFGTWGVITAWILYVIMINPIISYWSTRETARNIKSGTTSVFSSGLFSIGGIILYIFIVFLVGPQIDADNSILFFGLILIPLSFLDRTLEAINLGWKPHTIQYAKLSFLLSQVIFSLLLVYFLDMHLLGIIVSVAISYVTSILIHTFYVKNKLREKFRIKFLKRWLKISWLTLYTTLSATILWLDITLFSIITGSVIGIAFWTVSSYFPRLISNIGLISAAVYPKLLQSDNKKIVEENIILVFYFIFPITAFILVFARPILFILNPIYENIFPIVFVLGIQVFVLTLSNIFQSYLIGIERVDVNEKSTFKNFLKSKLFFVPTIEIIKHSTYLVILTIMLLILTPLKYSQIDLVFYWAIIALFVQIPFTIYFYILIKRNFSFKFDTITILKYFFATIISFGTIYILIDEYLNYDVTIFEFITYVLAFIIFGLLFYFSITFSIDLKTRKLLSAIMGELKKKNH